MLSVQNGFHMWIELIQELDPYCEFQSSASEDDIGRVEEELKLELPNSLKSLLKETNGVYSTTSYLDIVWSTEQILVRNREMRENTEFAEIYMTFQSLLFFASAGVDGILFAYQITASGIVRDKDIIVWYPIEDSRPVLASSLKDYLTRWCKGELRI